MNAGHPFGGPTPELELAIETSIPVLARGLKEER